MFDFNIKVTGWGRLIEFRSADIWPKDVAPTKDGSECQQVLLMLIFEEKNQSLVIV